ncbi:hypothetical protein AC578_2848 [Pseudocercospora eumusae]|uniref:Uncharacterized protein n=1 Tax=Pseudocercospora eumusae TaxID=321146 RepID=A0A139H452_9PEZI|nr:hypothetical protein AC578_2848 [Pseudocercospora eumusae]
MVFFIKVTYGTQNAARHVVRVRAFCADWSVGHPCRRPAFHAREEFTRPNAPGRSRQDSWPVATKPPRPHAGASRPEALRDLGSPELPYGHLAPSSRQHEASWRQRSEALAPCCAEAAVPQKAYRGGEAAKRLGTGAGSRGAHFEAVQSSVDQRKTAAETKKEGGEAAAKGLGNGTGSQGAHSEAARSSADQRKTVEAKKKGARKTRAAETVLVRPQKWKSGPALAAADLHGLAQESGFDYEPARALPASLAHGAGLANRMASSARLLAHQLQTARFAYAARSPAVCA